MTNIINIQMGNNNDTVIPQNFKELCHPSLVSSNFDKNQKQLQIEVYSVKLLSMWRSNLYPILSYTKYMLLPVAFRENSFEAPKQCCASSNLDQNSKACYELYIYTLRNEIIARKINNRNFKQHEIWKILKCGVLALRDWQYAYQYISIGKIYPQNFVLNSHGNVKIVNRFSFPVYDQTPIFWTYLAPENRNNSVVKYTMNNNNQISRIKLDQIYSLGITLLEVASLEQAQLSQVPTREKKKILHSSTIYNKDLISLILKMTEDDLNLRPNLLDLQLAIKQYKRLSKQIRN